MNELQIVGDLGLLLSVTDATTTDKAAPPLDQCPALVPRRENVPTVDILAGDGFSVFLVYRSQDHRSWEAEGGEARWMGSAVVFI